MQILWINLATVYFFAALARHAALPNGMHQSRWKPNLLFVFLAASSLILVSGLRSNIGDTFYYMHSYAQNTYTWEHILSQKDIGFNLLQMLLQQLSKNPQVMIFAVALMTNALIVMVLYRYSALLEISLFVYVASGMFLVSMNGLRQYLAAAVIFAATAYVLQGNFKRYALVILIASFFHATAIILLPAYFLVRKKAWSSVTLLVIAAAVMIVVGFQPFFNLLFSLLESSQYAAYQDMDYRGANVIRVLVQGVPLLFAYLGRKKLRERVPESDVIVNMSLLAFVFMLISTQNWIFARFAIYFGLYQLILIPWVIQLFVPSQRKLVYFVVLICYGFYFFYEHVISLNVIYRSAYLGI